MTSAIATSAALAACGDNTSVGAATDDGPGDGSCVEIEPMRAYRTCVSDAPLSVPGADATATRTITATVPDVDHRVDYLDGCLVVHDQGDSGWCALHAVAAAHEALHCQRGEQASVSPPHIKYRRVGRDFTSDDS